LKSAACRGPDPPARKPPIRRWRRTFEAQLEDGSWLHISERRTKDGGYVSVGTDITRIKEHEQKLVDNDLRLRRHRPASEARRRRRWKRQAIELADLAEKSPGKRPAPRKPTRQIKFLANMRHELRTAAPRHHRFLPRSWKRHVWQARSEKYQETANDILTSGSLSPGSHQRHL